VQLYKNDLIPGMHFIILPPLIVLTPHTVCL